MSFFVAGPWKNPFVFLSVTTRDSISVAAISIKQSYNFLCPEPFFDIQQKGSCWKWHSPDCKSCEMDNLRCGFKNKASIKVKCFGDELV
ncbi:hypothetical protein F2Q70_00024368 [Brassica cretica]|uniref:Uncharacterized protein n=1 Tax=Brassica cretica TaxID=69181 RepID=A0A8S9LEM6_BRACR|nr:hypothetical protein F2Q70_00024368 [Brassica cretica]